MTITHTDINKFQQMVRKAFRDQDSKEVRLDNTKRGYCLIYNFYADSCADTAEAEAESVSSAIIDGIDFVYSL